MIRKLLTTTAIAGLLASGAYAQTTTAPAEPVNPPAATQAGTSEVKVVTENDVSTTGALASNLIGETVYNGTGDGAENVGEVNDLVIDANGQVEAIIIGVGGFLGIGEKDVAIDYNTIDWAERDGDRWIVISATADQLKEQPGFDRRAYTASGPVAATDSATTPAPADQAAAPSTAGGTVATMPQGTTTSTDQSAQAPANNDAAQNDAAQAPAATTDRTTTAAIDKSTLKPLDTAAIRSEELVGTTVYGANDENVGEIGDVVLSQDGKVESVIIDVGGFLGMGEKEVAVGMDNLSFLSSEDGDKYLYTGFTKEQLEAAPEYDEAGYAAKRDEMRITVPN